MIIVTGGSDGLGARIVSKAQLFDQEVMNVSRRENPAATLNLKADLSKVSDVDRVAKAIQEISHPTALILNAGVLSLQNFQGIDAAEYARVMDVNLRAPMLLIAKLYDWIVEHEVDVVVVNSIAGMRSFTGQVVYDVSKWGLRGMTEDLRLELATTKCRVIGVYPGMLDTNIASKLPGGPMPKSRKPTIDSSELADMILRAITLPKTMQLSDIVIDRRV